jgi:hypothetical protein
MEGEWVVGSYTCGVRDLIGWSERHNKVMSHLVEKCAHVFVITKIYNNGIYTSNYERSVIEILLWDNPMD